MAATAVLQSRFSGAAPTALRREAHLRVLQSSWAVANRLPTAREDRDALPRVGDAIRVWSSTPQRRIPTSAAAGPAAFQAPPSHSADTPVSLTRRGRFLFIGLPIALGVIALILLGAFLTSQATAGESAPSTTATIEVSVVPGETLWELAIEHAPERDPRVVVAEMVELNNLHSSLVQAGQRLLIPAEQ